MRRMKYVIAVLVVLFVIGVAGILIAKARADNRFFDGYDSFAPLNTEVSLDEDRDNHRWIEFAFDGVRGHRIPSVMAMPLEIEEPVPCVVFLHGIGQSKGFLDEISQPFVDAGYGMVTFDQYMRGEREVDLSWWREAGAFRQRAALTVLETRRLVDYLETRNDVDHGRIYLVGASYGAITGATAAAMETRIKAAVMVYGGGDLPLLLRGDAITQEFETGSLGFLRGPITSLAVCFLAPSDPILYVGDVAPRPMLFQNGTRDQLIPTEAAQAFYDAANEPKEQRWYEGDHIGLDEATVRQVLDEALTWIQEQDANTSANTLAAAS